ncbi:MAG: von Willebrand factor type A domain-containing protein, partial [Planctomycetes bacterium]|nr:von Willebrand factor type A domain-containing protein [Planctomycetota bacterium]
MIGSGRQLNRRLAADGLFTETDGYNDRRRHIAGVPIDSLNMGGPLEEINFDFDIDDDVDRPYRVFGREIHDATAPAVPGTEQYEVIVENKFLPVAARPLSTFSIDVDTASYTNVRRFLNQGQLPPPSAVRIEEMVNYFRYDYGPPDDEAPFSVDVKVAQCPWRGEHRLLRVGLKGREIERDQRGPSNLVFLLDVSGSMRDDAKLPLVKRAMRLLVDQLNEDDRVAIVTYASNAGLKLESTCASDKPKIQAAIDALSAGGSTHGSAGIQLAYEQASEHFVEGGTNRVILATDGDLNVGITDDDGLVKLIRKKAKSGVFLTVLGFGTGNLKDAKMEKLADHGNGVYAYLDSLREAQKVLVEQISASLV